MEVAISNHQFLNNHHHQNLQNLSANLNAVVPVISNLNNQSHHHHHQSGTDSGVNSQNISPDAEIMNAKSTNNSNNNKNNDNAAVENIVTDQRRS